MRPVFPRRIVCLTEETTEVLYLLGEQHRIVGISGYTVRPPQARKEKPRVSGFTRARLEKILRLEPDLVLGFSDLQADIAAELVRRGLQVHVFNQRSVQGILEMIQTLGAMVGAGEKARALVQALQDRLERVRRQARQLERRPVVYFEEWDRPLITGIRWVSELIGIAGGTDCFADLALEPLARNRVVQDPWEVVRRRPDLILASWCGKRVRPEAIRNREGWNEIPAVRNGHVYGIPSPEILQPGPAALTDGLDRIHAHIRRWALHRG